MFKRILALVVAIVLLFTLSVVSFAESGSTTVQPRYDYTKNYNETLTIANGTASCTASLKGISGTTTKVVIKMTLQKKTLLWWSEVETWSTTSNTYYGTLTKTAAVKSGTYRVKAVYTVYSGSNSESITDYSAQKSY